MNKEAFVRAVAARCGILLSDAHNLVGALLDSLTEGLAEGERCLLRGVGTLHVVQRRGGKRRNPRTGEEVEIPPYRAVLFRPSHRIPFQSLTTRDIPLYTPPVRIRQGAFFVSLLI